MTVIDTHRAVKRMMAAGIKKAHAEAVVEAMTKYVLPQLAAKADLDQPRQGLSHDILQLRDDLTWRMIGILVAADGLLYALLRFTA